MKYSTKLRSFKAEDELRNQETVCDLVPKELKSDFDLRKKVKLKKWPKTRKNGINTRSSKGHLAMASQHCLRSLSHNLRVTNQGVKKEGVTGGLATLGFRRGHEHTIIHSGH